MESIQYYSVFISAFSTIGDPLLQLRSKQPFYWKVVPGLALWSLRNYALMKAVLRALSFKLQSTVITDVLLTDIGGVLEKDGRPVLWLSRRLGPAER